MKSCISAQKITATIFLMFISVLALSTPLEAAISLAGGLPPGGYNGYSPAMTVTAPDSISISEMGKNITLSGFTANVGGTYSTDQAIGGSSMGGIVFNGATVAVTPGDPAYWSVCTAIYVPAGNNKQLCCWYDDFDTVSYNYCVTFIETALPVSTSAGTAAATGGYNQILVLMPYTNDGNSNNSFTVEYKLSSDTSWTGWAANAPHVASPYTTTITGLAPGNTYDIRVTYADPDGVSGANIQTVAGITIPFSATSAGIATVTPGPDKIDLTMPYSGDGNANNTLTIEYKMSAAGSWTTFGTVNHPGSTYAAAITPLVSDTYYDVRLTYADPDGVNGTAIQTFANLLTLKNATLVGTASADLNNGTTISVTMPYSGDVNANNTFTVEYKLSGDSLWTVWATAAAHVPTPYTTAITGLTQGVSYDVRVTCSDADGVFGTAQQFINGVLDVTNWLNVGTLSVTEGGADNTLLVVANFSGDANGNGSMTIQYKRSADSIWTAGPGAAKKPGRLYATISGITYDTSYDVKVTFSDPDGLVGSSVVTKSLTPRAYKASPMLHNSLNANSARGPRWSGDPVYADGWGLPGTKYGTMSCSSCHTQPTSNTGMVVTAITDADARDYAKNLVKYRGQGSSNTLGNDLGRDAAVRRICEVCHTKTRVHRNDPSGQSWTSHQNNIGCLGCHPHDSGFQNRCYECHTGPGVLPATAYGVIP